MDNDNMLLTPIFQCSGILSPQNAKHRSVSDASVKTSALNAKVDFSFSKASASAAVLKALSHT